MEKYSPEVKKFINEEEQDDNLFWKPEDYNFKLVNGDGIDRGSKWEKDKFTLIRLSPTLWVIKKFVGYKDIITEEGKSLKKAKLVTKMHVVIDNKKLADIYLTSGLRG